MYIREHLSTKKCFTHCPNWWGERKLDQVYCAWLIKWVVKREIIQLAELCLSRWWIKSGTWWYWISIWRYWLVLGQYKLELLGFRWYRVSKGLVCLYILEKVEIWSGVTDAWHTDSLTTEYRATQLVSSIKVKLSHAIYYQSAYCASWPTPLWEGEDRTR